MPMAEAAKIGDIFVTVTGNKSVLAAEHFENMKDGAVICEFRATSTSRSISRRSKSYRVRRSRRARSWTNTRCKDGRRIYLLGEGRLINLAAAEGHPAAVMDMSFANQALSVEHLIKHASELKPQVYSVPEVH